MTPTHQSLLGLAMVLLGAVKTWLHVGSIPVLYLATCTGKTVAISTGQAGWFEQAHCWGCYMLVAGILVLAHAGLRQMQKRRSVAYGVY